MIRFHKEIYLSLLFKFILSVRLSNSLSRSYLQFLLLFYEFYILSETQCSSICYHFSRDHESSSFRKLARNKWIFRETCDFFRDQLTLLAINLYILIFWEFINIVFIPFFESSIVLYTWPTIFTRPEITHFEVKIVDQIF